MAAGVLVAATIWGCRIMWLPGRTIFEIGVAGILCSVMYFLLAGRLCLLEEHQMWMLARIREKAPLFEMPVRRWFGVTTVEAGHDPL